MNNDSKNMSLEIRRPAACEQDRGNRNGQRSVALASVEKRARLWGTGGGPGGVLGGVLGGVWSSGPGCLKSQTGQILKIFLFFGTISHFLAPFEVLTPTSILNFVADFFFFGLRAELWAQTQEKSDGNSGFDFLGF